MGLADALQVKALVPSDFLIVVVDGGTKHDMQ